VSDPPLPQQLPAEPLAGNEVSIKFTQTSATVWVGSANCKHGITQNATYLIAPGVPPLDHRLMVQAVFRQHDQIVGCDCPYAAPILNATVTFALPAAGVEPGQQRYVPQLSASIPAPAKNFLYGPGLTCKKTGAYQVVAKVQLSRGLAEGARGAGVILISAVPVLSVPMVDEGGKATANINGMLNLAANQSVAVGYENTSAALQDVVVTTLSVSEVWVPA
jgi:hypothetical protein